MAACNATLEGMCSWTILAGRLLLSPIFLLSGLMKILNFAQTGNMMEAEGMVWVPLFLVMSILVEVLGGLSLLLGFKARLGALLLVFFLVPVTLIFHDFWTYQGEAMQDQMAHFLKNVTIMGGLLVVAGAGAGKYALDFLAAHRGAGLRAHEELARTH